MAVSSPSGTSPGSGATTGAGKASSSFNRATDGREVEKPRPAAVPDAVLRSAARLKAVNDQPATPAKAFDQSSARASLHFNVAATRQHVGKTTQQAKSQPVKRHIGRHDKQAYTTHQGAAAAKNVDKAIAARNAAAKSRTEGQAVKIKRHIAPAPKPAYAAAKSKRGVSVDRQATPPPQQAKTSQQDITAHQKKVIEAAMARLNRQQGNAHEQAPSLNHSRSR